MPTKNGPRLILGLMVLVLIGGLIWFNEATPQTETPRGEPAVNAAAPRHNVKMLGAPASAEAAVSEASIVGRAAEMASAQAAGNEMTPTGSEQRAFSQPIIAEVRATRAMYMAHAPLRAPEIAEADSESNRKILQSMVVKAIRRDAKATAESISK